MEPVESGRPESSPPATPSSRFYPHAYAVLLLAVATAVVFGQTLHFDFVDYDDPVYITENPHIQDGLTLDNVRWVFTGHHGANWFPLTWLSHMLDLELHGHEPQGHHFTNVLLHTANALLLYAVLFAFTGALLPSALAALLFAIHPLHVESVAWVTGRKDLLSAFFGFAALLAYKRHADNPRWISFAIVFVAMALSLMAKSMLVTLPALLLLLDLWPLNRIHAFRWSVIWPLVREKIPLFGLSLASAGITILVQRAGGAVRSLDLYPFSVRLENALVAYVEYLKKTVWPQDLVVLYPHPGDSLSTMLVLGSALMLIGCTGFALALARRAPYVTVGWFWFMGTLIPVIGLVQVGAQAMADRYTYIPLIGLFIMAAWALSEAANTPVRAKLITALTIVVLLFFTATAWRQTQVWRDSQTLYTHTINVNPINKIIHNNLGHVLLKQGETNRALTHFWQALDIDPAYLRARINAANALVQLGDYPSAIDHYRSAVETQPNSIEARNNLANTFMALRRFDEAIEQFQAALAIDPNQPAVYNNLGVVYFQMGHYPRAIQAFEQALYLNPAYTKARENLAAAQARLTPP